MNFQLTHIFRKGNQIAYNLANMRVHHKCTFNYSSPLELPAKARGAMVLGKKRGKVPYIRVKCT